LIITKILLGLVFLLLGMGYLYHPNIVLNINAWLRKVIFNDVDVLLSRKRIGALLFILGALLLYMGFSSMSKRAKIKRTAGYWLVLDAQKLYRAKEYKDVIVHCQELLKRDPYNIYAWELLGLAWANLGNAEKAVSSWEQLLKIMPNHPVKQSEYFKNEK